MKIVELIYKLTELYVSSGNINLEVLITTDMEDNDDTLTTGIDNVSLEQSHSDESMFIRLYGSDYAGTEN